MEIPSTTVQLNFSCLNTLILFYVSHSQSLTLISPDPTIHLVIVYVLHSTNMSILPVSHISITPLSLPPFFSPSVLLSFPPACPQEREVQARRQMLEEERRRREEAERRLQDETTHRQRLVEEEVKMREKHFSQVSVTTQQERRTGWRGGRMEKEGGGEKERQEMGSEGGKIKR